MNKINIAIDGHSSCGKGTLAKHLAQRLGYLFIDSGAMYRAVTLYFLRNDIDLDMVDNHPEIFENIHIRFVYNESEHFYETFLNGKNVEKEIRTMEVSSMVSQVSAISAVRRFLVHQQREIGKAKGVVMDGRDIGTVVFPDAELKIFMTARPEIRAERRFLEMKNMGKEVTFEQVLNNLQMRDEIDSNRDDSPLAMADDAILLDNSDISREAQSKLAYEWVVEAIAKLEHSTHR